MKPLTILHVEDNEIVAGAVRDALRADAYDAGVDVFLPKPEGINELIPTVARLFSRYR